MCRHLSIFLILVVFVVMVATAPIAPVLPAYAQDSKIDFLRFEANDARAYADKLRKNTEEWKKRAAEALQQAKESQHKRDKEGWLADARYRSGRANAAVKEADKAEAQALKAEAELKQAVKTQERNPASNIKDAEIATRREQIEKIKSEKAFIWKNSETGEIVHQQRFRKLKAPFEYKGEGPADVDAEKKITRLEKEIAVLENGPAKSEPETIDKPKNLGDQTDPVATKSAESNLIDPVSDDRKNVPSAGPASNAIYNTRVPGLTFDSEQYFSSQTVNIKYPNVKIKENKVEFNLYGVEAKNFCGNNQNSKDDKEGNYTVLVRASKSGFCDYSFQLWKYGRPLNQKIGPIKYIRVREFIRTFPGAIKLANGDTYKFGDEVIVSVKLPKNSDVFLSKSSEPVSADLVLYRLGRLFHGGRVIIDQKLLPDFGQWKNGRKFVIGAPNQDIRPGIYELRLRVKGYVIDSQRFAVVQKPWENSLEIRGKPPFETGKSVKVALRDSVLKQSVKLKVRYLRASLFRLDDESGRFWRVSNYKGLHKADVTRPDHGNVNFAGIQRPGTYQARLTIGLLDRYLLDTLAFKVTKPSGNQFPEFLSIGNSKFFNASTPIPVAVRLEEFMSKAEPKAIKAAKPRIGLFSGSTFGRFLLREAGDPLRTWPVEPGEKRAWKIQGNLEPGSYHLSLQFKRGGNYFNMKSVDFWVLPKKASTGRPNPSKPRTFTHGEMIEVPFDWGFLGKIPSSANQIMLSGLQVELTGLGGFVPGCAYRYGPTYDRLAVNGKTLFFYAPRSKGAPLRFPAPDDPGLYLLRVLLRPANGGTSVISEELIDIVLRPPPKDTITLSKSTFVSEEPMEIKFKLENDIYQNRVSPEPPSYRWHIFRQGYRAEGGAGIFPRQAYSGKRGKRFLTNPTTVSTRAPRLSGQYELRLYTSGYSGEPFLARKKFTVVAPEPLAPPDWGPPGTKPPSDFPSPDYPFPKRGEFLDPGKCDGPFKLDTEPEKMDLRFVRRDEGDYLPIESALNFGDAFYLEGRLENPATKEVYFAKLGPAKGDVEEVTLFPDKDDPKVVRSELLYFIWDNVEDDANANR